jgi:hypothetical protein
LIAKALDKGIQIGIAKESSLLDTNVHPKEKLYGYHRLDDTFVFTIEDDGKFKKHNYAEIAATIESERQYLLPPEAVRT